MSLFPWPVSYSHVFIFVLRKFECTYSIFPPFVLLFRILQLYSIKYTLPNLFMKRLIFLLSLRLGPLLVLTGLIHGAEKNLFLGNDHLLPQPQESLYIGMITLPIKFGEYGLSVGCSYFRLLYPHHLSAPNINTKDASI